MDLTTTSLVLAQSSELTGLVGWVADVIARFGAVGVGLLTVLDNFFPPVPSEIVLPLAGYLAAEGRLTLVGAMAGSTLGSVGGALVLYEVGSRLGRRRVDWLMTRIPLMEQEDLDRARAWFERYGTPAVLLGRMMPGVRSLISVPAGVEQMPLARFTLATTAGTLLWNAVLVGAGYLLGRQWRTIGEYSDYINAAVIAALVGLAVRFFWKRRHRMGGRSREAEVSD